MEVQPLENDELKPIEEKLSWLGRLGYLGLFLLTGWLPGSFFYALWLGDKQMLQGIYALTGLVIVMMFIALMTFEAIRCIASALTGRRI